jgi:hypothetical protein
VRRKESAVTQSSSKVCSAKTATRIADPFWTNITQRQMAFRYGAGSLSIRKRVFLRPASRRAIARTLVILLTEVSAMANTEPSATKTTT